MILTTYVRPGMILQVAGDVFFWWGPGAGAELTKKSYNQGIVGCTPGPTYPVMGNPYVSPIYSPQESIEKTINISHRYVEIFRLEPLLCVNLATGCCLVRQRESLY